MSRQNITLVISVLLNVVLIFFLIKGCQKPVGTGPDQKKVDSLYHAIDLRDAKHFQDSVDHAKKDAYYDSLNRVLIAAKDKQMASLKYTITGLRGEVEIYQDALARKDTGTILAACNNIVDSLGSALSSAVSYNQKVDSLLSSLKAQHSEDTAMIAKLEKDRTAGKQQIEALQALLDDALKDNADLRKLVARLKRSKWLWFGLGAAAGGAVGHSIK